RALLAGGLRAVDGPGAQGHCRADRAAKADRRLNCKRGAMLPTGILETVLYAKDLVATERFYEEALGLVPFAKVHGRHRFYRCGNQMLLIFNPAATKLPPAAGDLPVPPHGMLCEGQMCFLSSASDMLAGFAARRVNGGTMQA